jgi:hypothetical protein
LDHSPRDHCNTFPFQNWRSIIYPASTLEGVFPLLSESPTPFFQVISSFACATHTIQHPQPLNHRGWYTPLFTANGPSIHAGTFQFLLVSLLGPISSHCEVSSLLWHDFYWLPYMKYSILHALTWRYFQEAARRSNEWDNTQCGGCDPGILPYQQGEVS